MRRTWLLLFMINFLFMSCSKDREEELPFEELNSKCIEIVLKENNMVRYDGQNYGCNFFFELFNFEGEPYFLLGNHCAFVVSHPIDCSGKKLCEDWEDPMCLEFSQKAQKIGIIGVQE